MGKAGGLQCHGRHPEAPGRLSMGQSQSLFQGVPWGGDTDTPHSALVLSSLIGEVWVCTHGTTPH